MKTLYLETFVKTKLVLHLINFKLFMLLGLCYLPVKHLNNFEFIIHVNSCLNKIIFCRRLV